jgi:hypothetical protein
VDGYQTTSLHLLRGSHHLYVAHARTIEFNIRHHREVVTMRSYRSLRANELVDALAHPSIVGSPPLDAMLMVAFKVVGVLAGLLLNEV